MANSAMQNFNYQVGKICRLVSRKVKLMAISNRRSRQLRHLGERVYIFKALQQEEDIWEKDEISQLLLTIADLEQEQEMIIDEINEIKAESPPTDACCGCQAETVIEAETAPPAATDEPVADEVPEAAATGESDAGTEDEATPEETSKAKTRTPRRKSSKKDATETEK